LSATQTKAVRDPATLMGTFGQKLGPTRSGKATLRVLDAVDARDLQPGDVLLTRWPTGWMALTVVAGRESAWGETGEEPQPCVVVDVTTLAGKQLTFAPEDLLRVAERGQVGA
jgi:hypothetical protein